MKQEEQYSYCHVVGCTDVGRKRQANEDSMGNFITPNGLVSVVCDGMGGHVGGATASRVAVDAIRSFLEENYVDDPRLAIGKAIDAANQAILGQAELQPELRGMGSTCVLLLVRNGLVYIGSVGDSRIYLIREHKIVQLTVDQSYVQLLVDAGQITPEEAEHHPRKNEILNALGIPDMKAATVLPNPIAPQAGDCFLLCSDGLSGMVSDKEIEHVVSRQAQRTSQERANDLVARANEHGGLDNITVQLVEFPVTPGQPFPAPKKKLAMLVGILAVCVVALGICIFFLHRHTASPAEATESIARDSTIVLGGIPFVKGGEIVTLDYGAKQTKVATPADTLLIRHAMSAASLNYDATQAEMKYNGSMLCFKDDFKGDAVCFSLADAKDSTMLYTFRIPVISEKKEDKPKEPTLIEQKEAQEKAQKVTSKLTVGKDSLHYTADFRFVFKAGDELAVKQVKGDLQLKVRKEVLTVKDFEMKGIEAANLSDNVVKIGAGDVKKGSMDVVVTGKQRGKGKTIKVILHNNK